MLAFPPAVYRARLARLRRALARHSVAAVLLTPSTNFTWLTGLAVRRSERLIALVVPRSGRPALIGPAFEVDRLKATPVTRDLRLWQEHEDPLALVAAACRDLRVRAGALALEPTTEVQTAADLARRLGGRTRDGRDLFLGLRPIKSADEIEKIKAALAIARRAFDEIVATLRAGVRESDLAANFRRAMARRGGADPWALVQFGPSTAVPHGDAGARRLRANDPVLLDFGCAFDGYQSDLTRSFWHGARPDAEYQRVRDAVVRAFHAGLSAVRPGASAESVDAAARAVIDAAGYGAHFTHRTGHGLGMDGHEHPYIVRGNPLRLASGMVFTIEPGIYLPGRFGVRHENNVRVTARGGEVL